jgi:uncharacterized protein (DUF305 family)
VDRKLSQFAILLVVLSLAGTSSPQAAGHPEADNGGNGMAWVHLVKSMEKMHGDVSLGKSSRDNDVDFVRLMVPHHQAAIDMAKTELLYGKDPQMRRLAQEIITDQQSETELMQLWLQQHKARSQKN